MKSRSLLRWSPLVGLLVGVTLASWIGLRIADRNQAEVDERFDLLVLRAAAQLERRMELYEYGLRGARGAVVAGGQEAIDRKKILSYTMSRNYAREFPGARGFGFIRRVPVRDEAAFLRSAKRDGWPDFAIRQLQAHDGERFVIQYIEPVANNLQAVGLDIASEENRRSAALRAMRTGTTSITDPITLVQADGKKNQGFLILLPVYRDGMPLSTEAERMVAGHGWTYAPLVIDEVLQDFDFYDGRIAIRVTATEAPPALQAIYASADFESTDNPSMRKSRHINVFGRDWRVDVQARPEFIASSNLSSPWLAFAFVVALTGAGALATYVLQRASAQAERLASEAALQKVNLRYRQLINGIQDYAIIQLDPSGKVTGWNTGAERIKGYTAAEILGQHMSVFYPADALVPGHLEQKLASARLEGYSHDEGWRVRKDGSKFWGSVTLTPTYDDERRLIGYSKITRDLTQRRQQEEELKRLLGLQKAILRNAGIAIIATNMEGTITLFNPSAQRLLGYEADEVIGKLTPLAFHDRQEIAARAQALSQELGYDVKPGLTTLGAKALLGQVDTHERTYLTKTGLRKPVLLSVTAILDEDNNSLGSLGIAADLSEQKRYQAELEGAREAAETANQAKSSFLANMSHEIRTPMNAILGMTQLVLKGELQPQQRDQLGKALSASKALLGILNDVLDYSKVEAGYLQLEQREMSLESVLSDAVSLFTHQAEHKGLGILLDLSSLLPMRVIGDPLRLSQVLSNLLSNAVKFTERGSVTLGARIEHQRQHQCRIRFSVSDTGIGISPQEIAQLFRPFSQATSSTSRRYGGTGLGLSICARLVELMGGTIEVRSTPGSGSEFFFDLDLPLVDAGDAALDSPDPLPFEHALVVSDHPAAARIIQLMLSRWKIVTDCASSGQEALDQLVSAASSARPYDLILTDWRMPGMDGVALIARIQGLVAHRTLASAPKIMMISAHAGDALLQHIKKYGASALLNKPVLPSALYNVLRGSQNDTAPATDAQRQGTALAHQAPATNATSLQGHHVLLVEDNKINQEVAVAFLRAAGLQVTVANHGREAVQQVQAGRFAAVLMDLHMPEMDGLEATRLIRAMPEHASLPIIAMTAAVMPQDQEACRQAGMNDFVSKPIDADQLLGVLRGCLGLLSPALAPRNAASAASSSEASEAMQAWRGVDDLDLADGLARMVGNSSLYTKLLQDFATQSDALRQELETSSLQGLPALVHKLKGTAGNLGFKAINKDCAALEAALRQRPDMRPQAPLAALLQSLETSARQIQEAAVACAPDLPPAADRHLNAADREQLALLLKQLPQLLTQQQMQALELSSQVLDLLQGTTSHEPYQSVHRLITQLQFPAASRALSALVSELRNN